MAWKKIEDSKLTQIADALRGRGHEGQLKVSEFKSKVNQLPRMTPYTSHELPRVGFAANQAVAVARSYWYARVSGKRAFTYSCGKTFYNTDTTYKVNDDSGNGLIDCSTFIRLVLSGVDYLHSPYATGNREDGAPRKDLYSWADEYLQANNVRYAAELAEYFFLTGRVLDGFDDLRPGDIVFHVDTQDKINNRFRRISHVSIVAEDAFRTAEGPAYYNVTSDKNGYVVIRTNWSTRTDYVFAARPNYEPARNYPELDESINLLMPPWYGVPTTKYGCTMSVSADGRTLTAVGQPTSNATFTLISEGNPIYLLPGSYKLSGAPKRSDVSSGYSWGLVVKNVNTGEDCGWDLGEGAEFTLAETTPVRAYIYISKSRNPDGYIWVPKLVGKDN